MHPSKHVLDISMQPYIYRDI